MSAQGCDTQVVPHLISVYTREGNKLEENEPQEEEGKVFEENYRWNSTKEFGMRGKKKGES